MTTPNNLPAELTSFVGRGPQLAELRRLLHRSRLVTLTGPGGAGKTRLALRLAGETLDRFPDGVWLLDLAQLVDGRLLEHTLAAACGIKEDPNRPVLDTVVEGLANSSCLIVLDGCEHVVDACAELSTRLLRICKRLAILTTSREPLGVTGEVIWRTPSLTVPRPEDAGHPELLMESEAIRLFVDRARLSRPEFELQATESAAIAQICTRLEGIPLAIELAAGLAGVMTSEEILDRLRNRFRLLTGGSRTSLPRHQTLRQAVDWSYGLLSPTEQALFARLSVFAGGFDLKAAEAVVGGDPIDLEDVLTLLSRLVLKSLVVAEPARPTATRYRMLDTIREYALEKLQQTGEAEWRRRHADYFTEWASSASKQLESSDQVAWLGRLDEEQANIRLALEWSISEQPDNALRLAAAMGSAWLMRRQFGEGLDSLTRTLSLETSDAQARARALWARAGLSRTHGDIGAALDDAQECIAIARAANLRQELSRGLTLLGIVSAHHEDMPSAMSYFAEAGHVAESIGDFERVSTNLNNLAMVESAIGLHEEALAHALESTALTEKTDNKFLLAHVLDTTGRVHVRRGDFKSGLRCFVDAIRIANDFHDRFMIAACLDGMTMIAAGTGDANRAVALNAASNALRFVSGSQLPPEITSELVEVVDRAMARLSPSAVESAVRRGAAMNVDDAVRYALGTEESARENGPTRLTGREVQVARLIATGLTNKEVAGNLKISLRTVDAHVEHIRNKIGLRTRSQLAVWVHERLGSK